MQTEPHSQIAPPPIEPPMAWIAVNTHPRREETAVANLTRQDFTAFCPKIWRTIRHARRTQNVVRPLFPGYLFLQIDPACGSWRPVLSTIGVAGLVRFGERLGLIDDRLVQSLIAREPNVTARLPVPDFRVGQRVRVAGGAFDELIATIIDMSDKDRLTVLMDLLNRKVKVSIDPRFVRAQ